MGRAGAAYTASQGGSASTDSSAPVRVGYLPITNATPLLIGHANGYYEEAGVPVQAPVLFRSWSSLAGESIAIPAWWSVHNVVVQQMLRGAGLTPIMRRTPSADEGTVQLLPMAPSDMLPALNNGVIGGYSVADPFNAAAAAQSVGGIQLFLGDAWRDHVCCVVLQDAATSLWRLLCGLAIAAVWPVALNTASGVAALDPLHVRVARTLRATRPEILRTVVLPSIRPFTMTGVRLALGIAWVVIVPAEMLGVSSGPGYEILNARDRLAYDEMLVVILLIGLIGIALDTLAQWLLRERSRS